MSTNEELHDMRLAYDKADHGVNRQELAAMGERAVRDKFNSGSYGHVGLPIFAFVSAWLADVEFARLAADSTKRDAREEETLLIARAALGNAKQANIISIGAAILATAAAIIAVVIGVTCAPN